MKYAGGWLAGLIGILLATSAAGEGYDFHQQALLRRLDAESRGRRAAGDQSLRLASQLPAVDLIEILQIGRASCRERV